MIPVPPPGDLVQPGGRHEEHDADDHHGGDGTRLPALDQARPGTAHSAGGRPLGSGRNSHSRIRLGFARSLVVGIIRYGVEEWLDELGGTVDKEAQALALACHVDDAPEDYRGHVWAIEALAGSVSRFNEFEQHEHGVPEMIVTWVGERYNVACTCVASNFYESRLNAELDSAAVVHAECFHAEQFAGALDDSSKVLSCSSRKLRAHFVALTEGKDAGRATRARGTSRTAPAGAATAEEVEVFDTGGLPVAVVTSGSGMHRVPASVKCARKATPCCYCDSARASSCPHTLLTRHLRQADAESAGTNMTGRKRDIVNSISREKYSPFDCNRAKAVDVAIFDRARRGETYVVKCPDVCPQCKTSRGAAKKEPFKRTILCHFGFCNMQLDGYLCPNKECGLWVSAAGKEECVVILSPCTAASVSLVRHMCHEVAVEGDSFSKVFRTWWRLAGGRTRAGIVSSSALTRGRRTVSRLMSTGMRLMSVSPPEWPFQCTDCYKKGRFGVVTTDGIWLGFLSRLTPQAYESYVDGCAPSAELLARGSVISREWVRRFA